VGAALKKLYAHYGVTVAAILGLGGPDLIMLFQKLGPVLDGLVRIGQFAVAIATVIYIYKKGKTISRRKRK
jgi:uncharacterized membrane protein